MAQAGPSVGFGLQQFHAIIVFHVRDALNKFIDTGYLAGAGTNAAAKYDNDGDSVGLTATFAAPDSIQVPKAVEMYQITEKTLTIKAVVTGDKYWKDTNLY
jgi:hypothetical protein